MICLGIESSCDDTSLAIVSDGKLLAHASSSQADIHAIFGGVVPEIASREHSRLIGYLCDLVLKKSCLLPEQVNVVAVARGPGLLGSLLVGMAFAKAFCLGTGAKLIGVNHLHAHLFACGLEAPIHLPALGLLVSGGHTQLCLIDSTIKVTVLGSTLDDAAGEAFDKAGKMLGLPYPAGKHIDELGKMTQPDPKMFPKPYLANDNLNFSFSGLKTAMHSYLAQHKIPQVKWNVQTGHLHGTENNTLASICASYTFAIVETLAEKTERAIMQQRSIKSLVLAGGVAANSVLRKKMQSLAQKHSLDFNVPRAELCADNGAMVAYLGFLLSSKGYQHSLNLQAIPRGQKIPDDYAYTVEGAPTGREQEFFPKNF